MKLIKITTSKECEMRFSIEKPNFTQDDIDAVRIWLSEMRKYGPEYIAYSENYRDHALEGKWVGCRASCISLAARIIYKVTDKEIIVVDIQRITLEHDYR